MPNLEEIVSKLHLTAAQSREVDRLAMEEYGMHSLVLMENAGKNAAHIIDQLASLANPQKTTVVAILAGTGNNGGDGWVISRHLTAQGYEVHNVLVGERDKLSSDNRSNLEILIRAKTKLVNISESSSPAEIADTSAILHSCDLIVDALLGTGATGSPREPMATLIRCANNTPAIRVAIDLPTGLNADNGTAAEPTFIATHTITMVSPKVGFRCATAASWLGTLHTIPIGVPGHLLARIATEHGLE
jgi:NAD(P)H-hydrate epimerase